jgi:hypothetical protein
MQQLELRVTQSRSKDFQIWLQLREYTIRAFTGWSQIRSLQLAATQQPRKDREFLMNLIILETVQATELKWNKMKNLGW